MSIAEIIGSSAGGLIIILTLIQLTPIKINPWSALAKAIGNALNSDIRKDLDDIHKDINNICKDVKQIKDVEDERYAITSRVRILRFNDDLLLETKHTKDYFDQILSDIDTYERYCDENPKFRNNMTLLAVENIKKSYQECMTQHKFLHV